MTDPGGGEGAPKGVTDEGARARLLRAFGEIPAPIAIVTGPKHVYEFANRAYLESGRFGPELLGTPFGAGARRRQMEWLIDCLDEVRASGKPRHFPEVRIEHPGESDEYFFDLLLQPILESDGSVDSILLRSIDTTSAVRARRRLEASEARLRRIVEASVVGLAFWNAEGVFIEANDAFLALAGYARESLGHDLRWESLFRRGRPDLLLDATGSKPCDPLEGTLRRKDGVEIPVLLGAAETGAGGGGVVFALDLRARKRQEDENRKLQQQLLQVQKLESLGVLAGGIAHDFNNLLTAILGGTSAALLSLPRESPAVPALESAMSGAQRAADLTRQLLAYTGKGHFDVRPLDLSVHVRELVQLLETMIPKKVQLRLELGVGLPSIEADVAQLQQIIVNLVVNGAEATGEDGGTVLVVTGTQEVDATYASTLFTPGEIEPGRYVFVEVHDTGCGMDEATQARIFDPFFTTKFTGRGLGLAAVLGIVRTHGGALKVYSTPGRGTTFKVFFRASELTPRPPRAGETDTFRGEGLVLVIDDDGGVRKALRLLLEHFGFEVAEAPGGREGLRMLEGEASGATLVILDMTMPELSGEETFRALRALRNDVPVLLSSGYNEIEATRRFTSKGLAGFLQKPFSARDLATKLKAALAQR